MTIGGVLNGLSKIGVRLPDEVSGMVRSVGGVAVQDDWENIERETIA